MPREVFVKAWSDISTTVRREIMDAVKDMRDHARQEAARFRDDPMQKAAAPYWLRRAQEFAAAHRALWVPRGRTARAARRRRAGR